ncbi:MAG: hypothetical protein QM754_02510 [Tepidisphaeraceae bacterium]
MRYRACLLPLLTAAGFLAGCETNKKPDALEAGRSAMMRRDYATATTNLDAYLKAQPNGPRSAEAFYLKGHALQDSPSEDFGEAMGKLQEARVAYIDALKVGTDSRGLEGLIRASLADVAFWQEDYAVAAEQGRAAYPLLEDPNVRAMALYRSGLSYQRLGKFEDGDRTLKLVVQYHPGTQPAARAQQRIGIRSFSVKIPQSSPTSLSSAMATLTRQGYAPATVPGESAINLGPYKTYPEANAVRGKIVSQYPKATVVP